MNLAQFLQVDDNDKPQLAAVLGCNEAELKDKLVGHAQAALDEYIDMYLGRSAQSQGREILEHRLALLMQNVYFKPDPPTDEEVARLFNLNQSQAKTLVRNTVAKHRSQLGVFATGAAKYALELATQDGDRYIVTLRAAYLAEWMNQDLARLNKGSPPLSPVRDSVSRYAIAVSSRDFLLDMYKKLVPE